MALKMDYILKIPYTLGRFSLESYNDILSNEQVEELKDCIVKEFIITNTYYKINKLNGNKENIEILLGIYKNETKQCCIATKQYIFVPKLESNDNFIKQGYNFLKTLDEFKNAVDVLEEA